MIIGWHEPAIAAAIVFPTFGVYTAWLIWWMFQ